MDFTHGARRDDSAAPERAWVTVPTRSGRSVRTNSYEDYPAGARFVAVLDADGTQAGWWLSETWGDRARASDTMAAIWSAAAAGATVWDDEYGVELAVPLAGGEVRACPHGTYVRVLDADGEPHDDGSTYWTCDEWVEDPELVMGAILGTASELAGH